MTRRIAAFGLLLSRPRRGRADGAFGASDLSAPSGSSSRARDTNGSRSSPIATSSGSATGSGSEQFKRQRLTPDEAKFYCDYFRSDEIWNGTEDLRSGLTGEFIRQSVVRLARADGTRKEIRFDELSAMTPETAALRSSLEGLKGIFTAPLAPPSRFSADNIPPGTILRRFDGVLFRVVRLDPQKGVVELEGVREPYSEFRKIDELRFLFAPPEGR